MTALSLPVLVEAAFRATVILAATTLVAATLRRSSASARHFVWVLGLTSALIVPALSIAVPKVEVPIVTFAERGIESETTLASPSAATQTNARHLPSADPTPVASGVAPQSSVASGLTPQIPVAPALQPEGANDRWRRVDAAALLLAIWAAGAAIVLGRMLLGLAAVQWMSRRTRTAADGGWLALARDLAADLGLRRVRFVQSATASMPMAWGVFRASVVMPDGADAWPVHRLRVVLLHELAHVKRRDCLTHLVAQVVCAAYWFNPLVWVAARRLRAERERACDDLVLAAGTRGSDYADELLDIARVMQARRFPAMLAGASLAMAHRSQLEGRLIAILDPSVHRRGLTRARTVAAAAVFALLIVSVASIQPWAQARAADGATTAQDAGTPDGASRGQASPDGRAPGRNTQETRVHVELKDALHTRVQTEVESAAAGVADAVAHTAVEVTNEAVTAAVTGAINGAAAGIEAGLHASLPHAIAGGLPWVIGQANPNPNPNPNPDGRRGGSKIDPRAIAALTEALKDSDKEVRETAMHALVQMRDPRMFEPLVAALKDASADVREQAAFGLGQLGDARAVEPLTAALRDAAADVREQAVFALGQLRDRRAVDPLIAALKDEKDDVREQAAFALGQLRDSKAVEALVIALKDLKDDVREQAAFALGQLGDPRAVEGLMTLLKQDASAEVRRQAAFALSQIRY